MLNVIQEEPWYKKGLSFKCTECGQCCTGAPGYVWVTEQDIISMADYLQLSLDEFCHRYIRRVKGRYSLIEHPITYDCVFLKDRKCQIYPVRPVQCQTYPWWPQNLEFEKDWKEAAQFCEGIQHQEANNVPLDTIQTQLNFHINHYESDS